MKTLVGRIPLFAIMIVAGLMLTSCAHQMDMASGEPDLLPAAGGSASGAPQDGSPDEGTTVTDSSETAMPAEEMDPDLSLVNEESSASAPSARKAAVDPFASESAFTKEEESPKTLADVPAVTKKAGSTSTASPQNVARKTVLRSPAVPTSPIQKGGSLLNRYYVLRVKDTPESISELIYGHTSRTKDLKAWNSGRSWATGHIVYYNSPLRPADTQMLSLYQEKGLSTEEYSLRKGDTLFGIARKRYGHSDSWKEIAVINHLGRPDEAKEGMSISLLPSELKSSRQAATLAPAVPTPDAMDAQIGRLERKIGALESEIDAPAMSAETLSAKSQSPLPTASSIAENGPEFAQKTEVKEPKQPQMASPDISQFVRKYVAFILAGFVVASLSIFWAIRRSSRTPSDGSSDY